MTSPAPVTFLRQGCGWLAVFDDGHIRCTHPGECPGPHNAIEVTHR